MAADDECECEICGGTGMSDETENVDRLCREDDGCPTEGAVLRREWRRLTAALAAAEERAKKAEDDCGHWANDYEERGRALARLTAALAAAEEENRHLAERILHCGDVVSAAMKERDGAQADLAAAEASRDAQQVRAIEAEGAIHEAGVDLFNFIKRTQSAEAALAAAEEKFRENHSAWSKRASEEATKWADAMERAEKAEAALAAAEERAEKWHSSADREWRRAREAETALPTVLNDEMEGAEMSIDILEAALATARNDALEDAARVADSGLGDEARSIADAIRALKAASLEDPSLDSHDAKLNADNDPRDEESNRDSSTSKEDVALRD
jgi:chromosome segregation ATPase